MWPRGHNNVWITLSMLCRARRPITELPVICLVKILGLSFYASSPKEVCDRLAINLRLNSKLSSFNQTILSLSYAGFRQMPNTLFCSEPSPRQQPVSLEGVYSTGYIYDSSLGVLNSTWWPFHLPIWIINTSSELRIRWVEVCAT
jgi:hypothetical protein